jgi:hypothetical protein
MFVAFNGDFYIRAEIEKLCKKYKIKTIIETGTFKGETTPVLAELAKEVHTIEINPAYYHQNHFTNPKITKHHGSSPEMLTKILGSVKKPCLFYLDAHWYDYWPLLDELKVIGRDAQNSVIAIHDCFVPERPNLGYDTRKGQRLDFEYISPYLPEIYPKGYAYHYNSVSTGKNRGVIYIYPK